MIMCCFNTLSAQQTVQNSIKLDQFKGQASIKILADNKAEITTPDTTIIINTVTKDGQIILKNRKDLGVVLEKLQLPKGSIEKQLPEFSNLNELERLLTKAHKSEHQSLYLQEGENTSIINEEEFTSNPNATNENPENQSTTNWFMLLGMAFIALVIGIILGRVTKKEKVSTSEVDFDEAMDLEPTTATISEQTAVVPKTKSKLDVHQVKAKYDKLYADSKILKKAYLDLKKEKTHLEQSDKTYYQAAFQDIILPLQNAIDNNQLDEIFKYLTIAATQFSAITRSKLTKKQKYDESNIALLLRQNNNATYPELTKHTAIDKTPANLRPIISILTQLGVKNLNNYIFQGYKITDL